MPEMMSTKGPLVKKDIRIWASCPYGHVLNLSKADAKHGSFPFGCPKGTFRQYTHTHPQRFGLKMEIRLFPASAFCAACCPKTRSQVSTQFRRAACHGRSGRSGEAFGRKTARRPRQMAVPPADLSGGPLEVAVPC